MASWRTAPRLQDSLCSEAQRRGSRGGLAALAGAGYKLRQSRAVSPLTVVVNSEINGGAAVKASEGSCIVAVDCLTRAFLSYQTELCCEHLFLIFRDSVDPLRPRTKRFLFKFQEREESHLDM